MPDVNYTNPTSIRPDYDWKPQGFLAGMHYSADRQRYEDTASLQDYMMKNSAIKSGAELSDYFADAPVRESKRASEIASNNATASTIGRIKENEATKGTLENMLADGTLKSKIATAAAEAAIKGGEASAKEFERAAVFAKAIAQSAGPGDMGFVLGQLKAHGASPEMLQFFSQAKDVKQLRQMTTAMTDGLMEADSKYQAHIRGAQIHAASNEKIQAAHDARIERVEAERIKAKQKTYDDIIAQNTGPVEGQMANMWRIMNSDDATPKQIGEAAAKHAQLKKLLENRKNYQPDQVLPNMPAQPKPNLSPDNSNQPSAVQRWTRDANGNPVRVQ